jgi:alkanesulfonate monooxygenase SsuD/methylene tetrahydromethanopterin reductase-like flavin-dependent oxidoreductase (luciferase family)
MDVGITCGIRYLPSRPQPLEQVYRNYLDDAVYGEQLGFDFIRTSEHHFAPDAWSPSQLPILACLAGRTSRMRLGTNVLLLPFHNPLRVAEDAATVDILSGGRLDLAVGSGSITDEFESYGLDPGERWGRMFEGLTVIRRCFEEDAFDHHGRYFHFPNVRMTTKPVQRPLPLWVGATGPKTIRRAAAAGYHLAGGGANDPRAVFESVGRDPNDFNVLLFVRGHLAESREQAWDEAEVGLHHERSFYAERDWIGGPEMRDQPVPPVGEYRDHPAPGGMRMVVGTPDEVLRQLEPRLKGSLLTHFGFGFRHAGMPTEPVRRAMDLFAKEVMPEIRRWGRPPVTGQPAWRAAYAH